ncbi:hypothetical protein RHA1_ro02643 [Rhodococcus jostii RHA1]|uniref:Antitoxin Xre/MbcA/ParS-like toxin-binding domain-containing protein n=1 Tax=Rhodococcus jostii (strain RHA1) TaxID=101510 RepID=Q0SDD8_RHOJR|nr:hypothetical protein RHA1_ro02643 [Rhodococcus jostii RHA1]
MCSNSPKVCRHAPGQAWAAATAPPTPATTSAQRSTEQAHARYAIRGIKDVLKVWAHADVQSWTIASWLSSPQTELDDRTPRQALLDGDTADVVTLARQAAERLAS